VLIPLSRIRIDGGTQPRAEINQAVVDEYAEAMTGGAEFPPVVVFHDGVAFWLADGFHRYHGARKAEREDIDAEVKKGTQREAVLYAVGANVSHGLRRTNADKRRAVEILLADAEWAGKTDRWIAEAAAVSPDTVNRIRHEQVSDSDTSPTSRTGRDGKTYQSRAPRSEPAAPIADAERAETNDSDQEPEQAEKGATRTLGPPRDGMQFARLAVWQLEQIRENDTERHEAFEYVKGWITGHEE
jgi:ParB-like chromosome segregation protein Spo0J